MRIMWVCNIMLPQIAVSLSLKTSNSGGWLTGLCNDLQKHNEIELAVCFPCKKGTKMKGQIANIIYYGFPKKISDPAKYDKSVETHIEEIINDFNPDILHIFGTEFPHSLSAIKVFNKPGKTVINLQGLVSVYSTHYYANLPQRIVSRYTFRDLLKNDNIRRQASSFSKRGQYEIEAIKTVNHVIGRTDWDRACSLQINKDLRYHFCNETLRDSFYTLDWDLDKCEKNSIFISQCSYPVKGFHIMIEAMPQIIRKFPDVHIYTTGEDLINIRSLKNKIKISSYHLYLREMIIKYGLQDRITFLGDLNEQQMSERFLKSHIFVLPSVIENSPNSLGEAMILGVPTVASDVGGVKNMLNHNTDGFIYQHDAPYMLAYYICKILEDKKIAQFFSKNSKLTARNTYSRERNIKTMLEIYNEICKQY